MDLAASVSSVGGKITVVAGTFATTAAASAIIQEVKKEDSFFKINTSVGPSSNP